MHETEEPDVTHDTEGGVEQPRMDVADAITHTDDESQYLRGLGEVIQQERISSTLTAEQAARMAEVAYKTWLRIESGDPVRNMTWSGVDRLFRLPEGTTLRLKADRRDAEELRMVIKEAKSARAWAGVAEYKEQVRKLQEQEGVQVPYSKVDTEEPRTTHERMRTVLRDVRDSMQPYMDMLDATQTVLDEVRIGTEVLARLAAEEPLTPAIKSALGDLRQTVSRYSKLTMDKGAWLELTRELVRLGDEIESVASDRRHYTVLVIFDPDVGERNIPRILNEHLDKIYSRGGHLEKMDVWGLRRLSTEILGRNKGVYTELTLGAERNAILDFSEALSDDERVLRSKATRANRLRAANLVSTFREDERTTPPVMSPRESAEDGERKETTK